MVDEHAMTIRLDDHRYQQLRREAFVRDIPRSDIIRQALDEYFAARTPAVKEDRPWPPQRCCWPR
jgi:predicted transcriptional regulator